MLVDRASQVIDLVSAGYSAAQLDSLDYTLVYSGRVRAQSRDTHLTRLELTYMNSTGTELGRSVSTSLGADDRWELLGDRELIPAVRAAYVLNLSPPKPVSRAVPLY